jgi:hypothetical protein
MKLRLATFLFSALALTHQAQAQGTLTPPPTGGQAVGLAGPLGSSGQPMPTMKTLHQIEPRHDLLNGPWGVGDIIVDISDSRAHYAIKKSGSYYLSANLEVSKSHGIIIEADDVVLDLNGFSISGLNAGTGVSAVGREQFRIENGTLAKLATGISASGVGMLQGLRIRECSSYALSLTGASSHMEVLDTSVSECAVGSNPVINLIDCGQATLQHVSLHASSGRWGIYCNTGKLSMTESRVSFGEFSEGAVTAGDQAFLERCEVTDTGCLGGFEFGNAKVSHCMVSRCQMPTGANPDDWFWSAAFFSGGTNSIVECVAAENDLGSGFWDGSGGSAFHRCMASSGDEVSNPALPWYGYFVGSATLYDCKSIGRKNSESLRDETGFLLSGDSALHRCSAVAIRGTGFKSQGNGTLTLRDCMASHIDRGVYGHASGMVDIKNCGVRNADGPGMEIEGNNGNIDSNTVHQCVRAVVVTGTGNVITRNQLKQSGLAHWQVMPGNRVAVILRPTANSLMIGGDGVASGFSGADPWANFVD